MPSLPQHGGPEQPGQQAQQLWWALLASPGGPSIALGHPAGAAAALSQREWVDAAAALIRQQLPPPRTAQPAAEPRRGEPLGTLAAPGLGHRHFQPCMGSESSAKSRGRAGHSPLPRLSPRTTARGGRAGTEQPLPKGCELNPVRFVR